MTGFAGMRELGLLVAVVALIACGGGERVPVTDVAGDDVAVEPDGRTADGGPVDGAPYDGAPVDAVEEADGRAAETVDSTPCEPQCGERECGDDGCGGSCGTCPEAAPVCGEDGLCKLPCEPQCGEKECGDDGCNGSCGECAEDETCVDGTCEIFCDPNCEDKECGDDGCGGSCGQCADEEFCAEGYCLAECPAPDCLEAGEKECVDTGHFHECLAPAPPCDASLYWGDPKECSQGSACVSGECVADPCYVAALLGSHAGCSFFSVDLALYPDPYSEVQPDTAPHALIVTNPSSENAQVLFDVTIDGIPFEVEAQTLCPGCNALVAMPVMSLQGGGIFHRAIHVTSDLPVSVIQVNPLDPAAAANDSSLLWPEHLQGKSYRVLTWPTEPLEQAPFPVGLQSQHGYFAVLATQPGTTEVALELPVRAKAVEPGGEMLQPGQPHLLSLNQFEVLQVVADGSVQSPSYDLSGALVTADQAVALFAGHEEAVVSQPNQENTCCADHLEEQLLPEVRWGTHHLCVKAPPRGPQDADIWRVQAGSAGAKLTSVPAIAGLNGLVLEPGEWVEAVSKGSFELQSDNPVQVVQYLVGKECTGGSTGDPAMVVALPLTAATQEILAVPLPGYTETTVVVVRPAGAAVTVDGVPVTTGFAEVGFSGWERAYVDLDGPAVITVDGGGLASLYGFTVYSGYGHPLGAQFE